MAKSLELTKNFPKLKLPYPDIPETDRTIIPRENNRPGTDFAPLPRNYLVPGFAENFLIQMHQHAVMKHRYPGWREKCFLVPFRRGEQDIE